MSRPPKSTAELARRGSFDHDPKRARDRVAAQSIDRGKLGPPPADFTSKHSPSAVQLMAANNELRKELAFLELCADQTTVFYAACRLRVRCARPGAKTGDFAQLLAYMKELRRSGKAIETSAAVGKSGKPVQASEEAKDWEDFGADGAPGLRVQ